MSSNCGQIMHIFTNDFVQVCIRVCKHYLLAAGCQAVVVLQLILQ